MVEDMRVPVYLNTVSRIYGPVYADSNYKVVFDNIIDDANYKLGMKDGIIKWTSVVKGTGTSSGIKLTYTVASKYISAASGSSVNVTTGSNGTQFYLTMIK